MRAILSLLDEKCERFQFEEGIKLEDRYAYAPLNGYAPQSQRFCLN